MSDSAEIPIFAPGDTFDRYKIEALLGSGGMGQVYRAHDARLHRKVALKFLRTDLTSDSQPGVVGEGVQRLLREARAAAALDHPNAVHVFDVGEHDGVAYLAMELVTGRSLRSLIGAPIPWSTRLRWLVDVARALAAAHAKGLVHRDVKPDNVMVRDDGLAKVLDFGIARRARLPAALAENPFDTSGGLATITGKGNVVGTPCYMAPEQMRGEAMDGRADQFAWGVVAYETLTGRLPWDASGDTLKLVADLLSKDPAPFAEHVTDLPAHVEATVLKAMSKSPSQRFGSMDEIVHTLEPYLEPAAGAPDLRSFRPPAPPFALTLTAAGVAANTTPPPRPRGRYRGALGIALVTAALGVGLGARLLFHRAAPATAARAPSAAPTSGGIAELPIPASSIPAARDAYGLALRSYADADVDGTRRNLVRAVELDPTMAAAHLRLGIAMFFGGAKATEAREALHKATLFRANLTERDATLLDAIEPAIRREPADFEELTRRLGAAVERYPRDAELSLLHGSSFVEQGDIENALRPLERATELDPKWVVAWVALGQERNYLGDDAGALNAWDRCSAIAPNAGACLWNRSSVLAQQGECAKIEQEARRFMAMAPSSSAGYGVLARALAAEGRPRGAVDEALSQKWSRLTPGGGPHVKLADEVSVALLFGDFAAAKAKAGELERAARDEPSEMDHAPWARVLVDIADELGDRATAGKIASDYLSRREGWAENPHRDELAIDGDAVPAMLAARARAGTLDAKTLDERRDAWIVGWEKRTSPFFRKYLWVAGYAATVEARGEAEQALAALPRFSPLPRDHRNTMSIAAIGQTYLLAGRMDEARPFVESGARVCRALEQPIAHTRAQLSLGTVREAAGDREGACAAYRVVLERWGEVKASRTATAARTRAAALHCSR